MEFRLEQSLDYLAVKEPTLHEFYQSAKPVTPSDSSISVTESDAFICSEKEKNGFTLYLAFKELSSKKFSIYTPLVQPRSARDYDESIDAAKSYMEQLGFAMNQVRLDYSTAMRQVIWGSIPLFKAPRQFSKTAKASNAEPAGAAVKSTEPHSPKQKTAPPEDCLNLDQPTNRNPINLNLPSNTDQSVDEIKRLQKKINVIQCANDEEKRYLEAEISSLKEQLTKALTEKDEDEKAKFSAEVDRLQNELLTRDIALASTEEQLAAQNRKREESEADSIVQVKIYEDKISCLTEDLESMKAKCAALSAEIAAGKELNEKSCRDSEQMIKAARERQERAENELKWVTEEKDRIERVATAGLDSARIDRKELVEGFEAAERGRMQLIEELRRDNAALVVAFEQAASDRETLKRELILNKRVAARERSALRAEMRRVVEGHIEDWSDEVSLDSTSEILASPQNCAPQSCMAEAEIISDSSSLEVASEAENAPEESDIYCRQIFAGETGDSGAMHAGAGNDGGATEFTPAKQAATFPPVSPDDLFELYESENKVQAVPDGYRVQRSGGYVCAVNCGGKREIYLIWQMLESKQVQLYTPRQQPQDEESFRKVLQDALYYFDSIGFMMTPVDLSGSQRVKAIGRMSFSPGQ